MPPLRPLVFVDYVSSKLSTRWSYNRVIDRFRKRSLKILEEIDETTDSEATKSVLRVLADVPGKMPEEGEVTDLSRQEIERLKQGCSVLRDAINEMSTLLQVEADDASNREMDEAEKEDDEELEEAMGATNVMETDPINLKVFTMENPNAAPIFIDRSYTQYAEVMWHLVVQKIESDTEIEFEPELWIRNDNGHPWGSHRSWMFVEGAEEIDCSRHTLDVVNVAKRKDYIVVAVNEGEGEIPLPINVPRLGSSNKGCCKFGCGTFGRHLDTLWHSSRQVEWVGQIKKGIVGKEVLDKKLDTSIFIPRTNELYIQCSRVGMNSIDSVQG